MTAYLVLDFSINDLAGFLPYADAQVLFAVRHRTTNSRLVLVEGCV